MARQIKRIKSFIEAWREVRSTDHLAQGFIDSLS